MPRRIADYSSTAGWNDLNLLATIGGFIIAASMIPFLWNIFISLRSGPIAGDDPWEAQHPRVGDHVAAARLQLRPPAGDPLRAAGVRRAPRPAAAGALSGPMTMTTDSQAHAAGRAQPAARSMPHDTHGGHQQPGPRDAPVHHLRDDVLRRPVRGLLQHPGERRPVAAHQPETAEPFHLRSCPSSRPASRRLVRADRDDPADPQLVHLPVRRCGPSAATTGPRSCGTSAVTFVLGIIFLLMQLTDYAILGSRGH